MDELQKYFETVYTTTKQLAELTLLMQGYEQGKKTAESSPFSPQTAKTDFVSNSSQIEETPSTGQIKGKNKTEKGIHKFTKKELNSMPEKYLMIFKQDMLYAHKRITKAGYVEIRITIKGKNISGVGKDEETAVRHFIAALRRAEEEPKSVLFKKYVENWLETVKRPHIKASTYVAYSEDCKAICNAFGSKRMNEIKQLDLQKFINGYCDQGKLRTAQRLHVMLSAIFDYAVVDELVRISPMKKVVKPKVHPKHGNALTRAEEKALWNGLNGKYKVYAQIYLIMIYTGVRRGEFNTIRISDGWVYVTCEKTRKDDGEVIRKLPVNPMLERALDGVDIKSLQVYTSDIISRKIKIFCPDRHTHDLRHTFITRCQEYDKARDCKPLGGSQRRQLNHDNNLYPP